MQLEGYCDLIKLTSGGMSTVYKARQVSLDRTVAIKFLSAELLWDDQAKIFFDQESLVIARLNHPNIIHIIDRGVTPNGRPYFVMEYIEGRELHELKKQKDLTTTSWVQLLMQTCKAMSFAHKNGVVHRDIKPANILIDGEGHVHILDFGIAWLEANGKPQDEEVVGTPDFMSPEQFSAPDSISYLSDIYSIGAVMYQLFTGYLPADHFNDLAGSMSALPEPLSRLITSCLETDPDKRPQSADEVSFQLLRVLKGAHIKPDIKAEAKAAIGSAADKFQLLDVINRSQYGAVYLFEDKARHSMIVVKKSIKSHAGYAEANKLRKINNGNIIKILGTSKNNNAFIVVMEYLTGGSLQDRLSRPFSLHRFKLFAVEFCKALQAAHDNNVVHGNLRPANILFDEKGYLKVSDFGFKHHYIDRSDSDWYHLQGSMAASIKADIYSTGCIFYQMLTGCTPTVLYAQLKPQKEFEGIDSRVQNMITNMIETQSINSYGSFSEVIDEIALIKTPLKAGSDELSKDGFNFKLFLLVLVVINLLVFAAISFM